MNPFPCCKLVAHFFKARQSLQKTVGILFGKGPGNWDSWDGWDGWDSWDQEINTQLKVQSG